MEPHTRHELYSEQLYIARQIRDCAGGSNKIKRGQELYLPMPSAMRSYRESPATGEQTAASKNDLALQDAPWYHSNPAYRAYLQRARFPDITAHTLRGLVGVATKKNEPEVELPSSLAYLDAVATLDGRDLRHLHKTNISELLQVGRRALVLDIRSDNTFYIAEYSSESYINWKVEVIEGERVQTYAEFEQSTKDDKGVESKVSLVYQLEIEEVSDEEGVTEVVNRVCAVYRYKDGKQVGERRELAFMGTTLDFLPIVNVGAEENEPEPSTQPLQGVSDCALDLYRHSADLNNSHFMTCNPTLLFTGVDSEDAPTTIGSTIAIALRSAEADGKYLEPEASSLDNVVSYMAATFDEAVQYGAALLGPTKRAAESGEALALRKEASGATLVTVVDQSGKAIQELLQMASKLSGDGDALFLPNTDFAELSLTAQEITALVTSWLGGAISHMTLLENLSDAGRLSDRTPEQEMQQIENEGPQLSTSLLASGAAGIGVAE